MSVYHNLDLVFLVLAISHVFLTDRNDAHDGDKRYKLLQIKLYLCGIFNSTSKLYFVALGPMHVAAVASQKCDCMSGPMLQDTIWGHDKFYCAAHVSPTTVNMGYSIAYHLAHKMIKN